MPNREQEIFLSALERTSETERAAFLNSVCADAPELRARIENLLRAATAAGGFLAEAPLTVHESPGALIGCYLALRKSSYTRRRMVYVPTPLERFLGWFAVLAFLEGSLRFFMTLYWAWVGYQNGKMGHGV